MVEREHHYRNCQPQGHPQTVSGCRCSVQRQRFQCCAVPLRDQVQSQQHQYANKREYQNTHRFNDHLLTEANDGHHTHDQDQRQNRTWRWRHTQLVRHEAFNCIGDCHAINQQDRVDSEEVEQSNQFTCANTKVFFYNLGDVFARVFTRQYEASQAAVSKNVIGNARIAMMISGSYRQHRR